MPYPTNASAPKAVRRKLKGKKLRQWHHVWNSEFERHGDESRAFASAWSVAQKSASGASITKPESNYVNRAPGQDRCDECTMFIAPDACSLVKGIISPQGHCKFFERKSGMKKGAEAQSAFSFFLPISKIDKERRQVSGYASTPALDLDGEIVSLDAVKSALPGYMQWRNIRRMHTPDAVGVAKEANVDNKGLFLTAKIVDDDAWHKCLEGVYKGFSIGGRKLAKTGNVITELEMVEISIVDRPANPECKFEIQKGASADAGAFLLKARAKPARETKILQKAVDLAANVSEFLTKNGEDRPPPAADGFQRPAPHPVMCKRHNIENCAKCAAKMAKKAAKKMRKNGLEIHHEHGKDLTVTETEKRDVGDKEREALASQGKALPDGSFPIANRGDLANARQAIGRAKNPSKARAHIVSRARDLGVKLPDKWTKKSARILIAAAEIASLDLVKSVKSAQASFLTLGADNDGKPDASLGIPDSVRKGEVKSSHEFGLGEEFLSLKKGARGGDKSAISFILNSEDSDVEKTFIDDNDPIARAIVDVMKRGKAPTRMARMGVARANLKKARKTAKAAEDAIKSAHAMHKAAYLAKAAGGKKPVNGNGNGDDDADDFDHQGAMQKLQKAYGELQTLKTFVKKANVELKKAAGGRSGQSGQEVSDGNQFYQVPPGIRDISGRELSTTGPGSGARTSMPQSLGMEGTPPGKMAKKGFISEREAEAMAKAAAAEAKIEVLERMPAMPMSGRRPATFDARAFSSDQGEAAVMFKGVDMNALVAGDENSRTHAAATVIGNRILGGLGKNVFDPQFRGTAGAGGAHSA